MTENNEVIFTKFCSKGNRMLSSNNVNLFNTETLLLSPSMMYRAQPSWPRSIFISINLDRGRCRA